MTSAREYTKQWKAARRERGLCVNCAQPVAENEPRCPTCQVKNQRYWRAYGLRRRATAREEGTRMKCRSPRMESGLVCERHYLMNRADFALGSTSFASALKQRLLDQDSLCYYTGVPLVLGVNDSLDHLLSVSKHPELRSDINNVVWCTREINTMKNGMDRDEFLAMCRLLSARWPG